jgi:hypothetical protein
MEKLKESESKPGTSSDRLLIQPTAVFFNGKLRIFSEIDLPLLKGDVLVNFCASDILSGFFYTFLNINFKVMKHFLVFMNILAINLWMFVSNINH